MAGKVFPTSLEAKRRKAYGVEFRVNRNQFLGTLDSNQRPGSMQMNKRLLPTRRVKIKYLHRRQHDQNFK